MDRFKDFLHDTRDYISRNPRVIGLAITAVLAIGVFGAVVYVQSSVEYSLYKLHQAVKNKDIAAFDKYWEVDSIMSASAPNPDSDSSGDVSTNVISAFEQYRDKYYYDLSLIDAFTKTDIRKEEISDGALIFTDNGKHETAMRAARNQGHYVITEFAELR